MTGTRLQHLSPTARSALTEIVERLTRQFDPLRIVLFGSQARGDARAGSDIDLMVVVPDGTDRRKTAIAMYESLRGVGSPKDLVVVTPSQIEWEGHLRGMTINAALREGVTVYERSEHAVPA